MLDEEDWDELLTQDDGSRQPTTERRSTNNNNTNAARTLSGNKLFSDRLIFSRRNYNYNNYNTYITPGSSAPTYSSTSVNMNYSPANSNARSNNNTNNNNTVNMDENLFDSTAPIPIQSESNANSNTNQRQSPMSVLTIIRERSKSFSEAIKDIFQKTPVNDRTAVTGVIASPAQGATSPRDILVTPTSLSTPLNSSQSSQPSESGLSPLSHYLHAPTTDDLLVRVPSWAICAGKSRALFH